MTKYILARIYPKVTYTPEGYDHAKYLIEKDLIQRPFYDIAICDEDNAPSARGEADTLPCMQEEASTS